MKETNKLRYEVDPFNRPRFRNIIDGKFAIDKNNNLIYELKTPSLSSKPHQIKLKGIWSLDKNHNLVLSLVKDNQFIQDKITLSGEIINAKSDKLEFCVSTKDSDGNSHFYTLHISGVWQADKYNRLNFLVLKEKGSHDELVFNGSWEVNRQNQITYTYARTILKRKTKLERSIIFKGFWDITDKYRVIYVLDKKINSFFEFRVSLAKPAKRGLEYEIGLGARPPLKKRFTLFGLWKINKKLGLLFEMPYEQGKIRSIIFGAVCKPFDNYNLEFRLRNNLNKDLGIDLRLSKNFLDNQGQLFVEALKDKKEFNLMAGVGFRW